MDRRHQEYVDYYRARLKKFENNPLYPNSEAAERELYEAIATAESLEQFGERLTQGKQNLKCAIAYVRDTEKAWVGLFLELDEQVRAKPYLEVLKNLDETEFENVQDLNTMVSEVHTRWNIPISMDESLRSEFWNDWKVLEDIECNEKAQAPERWHEERQQAIARERERGTKSWNETTLPELRKFDPEYKPDWNLLWESRHRRRFPVADPIVERRIRDHKLLLGEE